MHQALSGSTGTVQVSGSGTEYFGLEQGSILVSGMHWYLECRALTPQIFEREFRA